MINTFKFNKLNNTKMPFVDVFPKKNHPFGWLYV